MLVFSPTCPAQLSPPRAVAHRAALTVTVRPALRRGMGHQGLARANAATIAGITDAGRSAGSVMSHPSKTLRGKSRAVTVFAPGSRIGVGVGVGAAAARDDEDDKRGHDDGLQDRASAHSWSSKGQRKVSSSMPVRFSRCDVLKPPRCCRSAVTPSSRYQLMVPRVRHRRLSSELFAWCNEPSRWADHAWNAGFRWLCGES